MVSFHLHLGRRTWLGSTYLLWRNLVGVGPHVHLLVGVDTREDEEDSRPPGSTYQQSAESEDNGPLVLLEISRPSEEL